MNTRGRLGRVGLRDPREGRKEGRKKRSFMVECLICYMTRSSEHSAPVLKVPSSLCGMLVGVL